MNEQFLPLLIAIAILGITYIVLRRRAKKRNDHHARRPFRWKKMK